MQVEVYVYWYFATKISNLYVKYPEILFSVNFLNNNIKNNSTFKYVVTAQTTI